jgi:hypothetical protein
MGKLSRTKRGRHRPHKAPPPPGLAFQLAMVEAALAEVRDHGQACVLCSRHGRNAGLFIPKATSPLVAPPGEPFRVAVYALCPSCSNVPNFPARVEAALLAERSRETPA